jgi:hypothetical protein
MTLCQRMRQQEYGIILLIDIFARAQSSGARQPVLGSFGGITTVWPAWLCFTVQAARQFRPFTSLRSIVPYSSTLRVV